MTAVPMLELRGVDKSFGPVHVLSSVDFAARAGEVTALVKLCTANGITIS